MGWQAAWCCIVTCPAALNLRPLLGAILSLVPSFLRPASGVTVTVTQPLPCLTPPNLQCALSSSAPSTCFTPTSAWRRQPSAAAASWAAHWHPARSRCSSSQRGSCGEQAGCDDSGPWLWGVTTQPASRALPFLLSFSLHPFTITKRALSGTHHMADMHHNSIKGDACMALEATAGHAAARLWQVCGALRTIAPRHLTILAWLLPASRLQTPAPRQRPNMPPGPTPLESP